MPPVIEEEMGTNVDVAQEVSKDRRPRGKGSRGSREGYRDEEVPRGQMKEKKLHKSLSHLGSHNEHSGGG